ncbi:MAG: hypothetical protein RLY16_2100 [Bacteroidota bacterium]|jgi:predicted nicotinamide N-methyase
MIIPATVQTFQFNQTSIQVMIPDPNWVQLNYASSDTPHLAFWAKPWPAAIALAEFIATEPNWVENRTVLELAAGLAIPALTAANFAKTVLMSEYVQPPIHNMEASISINQFTNCTTACINWQSIPATINPQVVLLSDICYNPGDFDALRNMMEHFLNNGATIILSTPHRLAGKSFLLSIQNHCIHQKTQEVNGTMVSIWVLRHASLPDKNG